MYSSSEAINRLTMVVAVVVLFGGCRATQLLPPGLLPAAASSDEPSFERLLEIEDRQQGSGRQASKTPSRPSDVASRRRPGSTSMASQDRQTSDAPVSRYEEDLGDGEASGDPELQRTRQALQRYVGDRNAAGVRYAG